MISWPEDHDCGIFRLQLHTALLCIVGVLSLRLKEEICVETRLGKGKGETYINIILIRFRMLMISVALRRFMDN
jgi:hypothetical protein